jgi:integrase
MPLPEKRTVTYYQNKRNGYWYARFTIVTRSGRRRSDLALGYKTRPGKPLPAKLLERLDAEYRTPFATGTLDPFARSEALTLGEAIDEFLRTHTRAATLRTYTSILRLFAGHVGPSTALPDVRRSHVASFIERPAVRGGKASGTLSPRTQAKDLRHIKAFFRWCAKRENERGEAAPLLEDPDRLLPRFRETRTAPAVLLPGDYRRLQETLRADYEAKRHLFRGQRHLIWQAPVWDFFLGSGARLNEVRHAQIKDFRPEAGQLWIGAKTPERDGVAFTLKGTREHYAHLDPLARRAAE